MDPPVRLAWDATEGNDWRLDVSPGRRRSWAVSDHSAGQIMLYNVDLNSAQTRASMPVVSHLGTGIPHGG